MTSKSTATPWWADETTRAAFWQMAQEVYGLGHAEALKALNVASIKDWKGTQAEAISILTAKRDEFNATQPQPPAPVESKVPPDEPAPGPPDPPTSAVAAALLAACQALPEATAGATTKVSTGGGFVWLVTVRAGLPPDLEVAALDGVVRQMARFEHFAKAYGWQAVADGRDTVAMKPRDEQPRPALQMVPAKRAAQTPPPAQAGGNGDQTFRAEKLTATVSDGKVYWKVRGGKFAQYGITIWPEVLVEAGFDPDMMNPAEVYDLTGLTAAYALNDKGKPSKVIALAKAA